MKNSVTVLICALNEEKNIGLLLKDVLNQKYSSDFAENFHLAEVIVVCDGSTDRTSAIVNSFSETNKSIKLVRNERRIGKIFSLDKAFKIINSDYTVLFDADVRLEENTIEKLVLPFKNNELNLIGGNPIPVKPTSILNFAEQASYFSWLLLQEIKLRNPNSIYSAHGRVLAVSKEIYKNLNINQLSTPGDDQYMYLMSKGSFLYQKDSIVRYRMPSSAGDYLKQSVRFRKAKLVRGVSLSTETISKEFFIYNKLQLFIKVLIKNPYGALLWACLYNYGFIVFLFSSRQISANSGLWNEVRSTK